MGNMLVHVPAFENIQPLVCIVNKCTEKKYLSLSKGGNSGCKLIYLQQL